MKINDFAEYIELIDKNALERLSYVFDVFYIEVDFNDKNKSKKQIYDKYYKEIIVLQEFGIINNKLNEKNIREFWVETTQLQMARYKRTIDRRIKSEMNKIQN